MLIVEHDALKPYTARYEALEKRPLRVTCTLREGARLAGYDPLNLDDLLAWSVVQEATEGAGVPPEAVNAYALPVPLACLWRSPQGLPLWACTPLLPAGDHVRGEGYWHKRVQDGRWTRARSGRFNPNPRAGRWMERRVPLPHVLCREWDATCVGNAEETARLLTRCTFIGKKRAVGFGEVERWRVEPTGEFSLVREGALTRNVPLAVAELLPGVPAEAPTPVGWTPPQWKSALWLPGWLLASPVSAGGGAEWPPPV